MPNEPDDCVSKEDCRRIHEDITYQLNDIKDQIDDVDKKLYTHDKQAQDICSSLDGVAKDVDRIDETLKRTSDIVERTALIQEQAEKDRIAFQGQMQSDKQFYQKMIWRMLIVGSIIVLGYFGLKAGEMSGLFDEMISI